MSRQAPAIPLEPPDRELHIILRVPPISTATHPLEVLARSFPPTDIPHMGFSSWTVYCLIRGGLRWSPSSPILWQRF